MVLNHNDADFSQNKHNNTTRLNLAWVLIIFYSRNSNTSPSTADKADTAINIKIARPNSLFIFDILINVKSEKKLSTFLIENINDLSKLFLVKHHIIKTVDIIFRRLC